MHILNTAKQVYDDELLHVILDLYNALSLKEGERMRWAGTSEALQLTQLDENVPILLGIIAK